jgi:hypothetical protein
LVGEEKSGRGWCGGRRAEGGELTWEQEAELVGTQSREQNTREIDSALWTVSGSSDKECYSVSLALLVTISHRGVFSYHGGYLLHRLRHGCLPDVRPVPLQGKLHIVRLIGKSLL